MTDPKPSTPGTPLPGQFRIGWSRDHFTVSVPNYPGGDVVPVETVQPIVAQRDSLIEQAKQLMQSIEAERQAVSRRNSEIVEAKKQQIVLGNNKTAWMERATTAETANAALRESRDALVEALREQRDWFVEHIDGGEECRRAESRN